MNKMGKMKMACQSRYWAYVSRTDILEEVRETAVAKVVGQRYVFGDSLVKLWFCGAAHRWVRGASARDG